MTTAKERRNSPRAVVILTLVLAPLVVTSGISSAQGHPKALATSGVARQPKRGNARLEFVGTISPAQASGRSAKPAAHLPLLSHGGSSAQPTPSATASGVAVASLSLPGPSGSSTDLVASTTQPLTSLDSQVTALGSDQSVEPPDTILATNGTDVMEMVNDSGTIWTASGGTLTAASGPVDLNKFFYVPTGYTFSDPRIVYDPVGGRWIATGVDFSSSGASLIAVDVSASSDPTGSWAQYQGDNSSSVIHDQPKLGLSGEQVVLSWNDFLLGSLFEGATTWVFDRSGLESGTFLGAATFGPDSSAFSIAPATVVTGNTEYAVWNDSDCSYSGCSTGAPSLGVITIGGTPASNNVTWNVSNPSIAATSNPPAAAQPAPGNALNTDDDRLLGASWSNGMLWTTANDACTPPGDTAVRSCLRLIEVSLSGTPTIAQDFDAAAAGANLFYPAVALDGNGNLAVTYSASSPKLPASVGTAGQAAGSPSGSLSTGPWIESGSGAYVDGTSSPRWGDYSAAVAVPGGTAGLWGSDIWVAGEYTASAGTVDWGTAAAQLHFSSSGSSGSDTISLTASPNSLTAGSGATAKVTATVTNGGSAVGGDTVAFATSGTCGLLSSASAVTDSIGTAMVTYSAAKFPGTCTITATDSSGGSGSVTITQVSNAISLTASPNSLTANSGATATVTATVTNGTSVVVGDMVTFAASGTCGLLSSTPQKTDSSGTAMVTYTAAKKAGTCTITATDSSGGSGSVTISQKHR